MSHPERSLFTLLFTISVLAAHLGFGNHAQATTPESPNVVIIFIDDMGWGDVGFNGATGPKTPNLDRMASEGMRMNDFYVGCSVCSGSRATLLTGCHFERLGINQVLFPNSEQGLHREEVTIADIDYSDLTNRNFIDGNPSSCLH